MKSSKLIVHLNEYLATKYPALHTYLPWASWLWELRTGVDIEYAGISQYINLIAGELMVRAGTGAEFATFSNSAAFASWTTVPEYVIVFKDSGNLAQWAQESLMLHEIGHILGFDTHTSAKGDLMYPLVYRDTFPITMADANAVSKNLSWEPTNLADVTSAIMLPDFDLYHPNIAGHQGYLNYVGTGTNGKHKWKVTRWEALPEGSPSSVDTIIGHTAYISSVQTPAADYGGELIFVGQNTWELSSVWFI